MKLLLTLLSILYLQSPVFSAVDTLSIDSKLLNKKSSLIVIIPESYYDNNLHFPVVYLLHGKSGRYDNWISLVPEIVDYAEKYNFIIVCPEGGSNGWYLDSPLKTDSHYESFFTDELIPFIDENYRTIDDAAGRAITGLSMGGHGALYLTIRNPELFGQAGSMSGALDFASLKRDYLKEIVKEGEERKKYSVYHLINNDLKGTPIIIDCGLDDFLYEQNIKVHEKLKNMRIDHDFILRPGIHNWKYWKNAVEYQLLFFYKNF